MNTKLLSAGILSASLVLSAFIVTNGAYAQEGEDAITYPVAELGGCTSKDECKAYCDDADHLDACLSFAEKNGLMSEEDLTVAKKFAAAGAQGPGGCTGKDECEAYCDDINHIDECVAFAEKTGMLPPGQLAEAKQVQAAIAKGVKPPACRGKEECDAYCEDSSHMKECIAFGEASGFLQGKELEDAKKMLTAIDNGAVPPPCRGKDACDAYCSEPDHMEACMTFAQAAGFMTEEEAQNSQKMLAALKKGVKPPACQGKEGCDAYCSEPAHSEECITFAVAAGFMDEKDAEMARKTGGKGPGGCRSKESCDSFCNENQQACVDFAIENGMMSAEDAAKMKEGQQKFAESLQNMPAEVETCVRSALGDDFEKIKSGQGMPPPGVGEKIGECFSQMMRPPEGQQGPPPGDQQEQGRMMPPEGQRPPDGQFAPGAYPGPMPPEGQRPPDGQFAPGTYPGPMPLEGERPPGEQFAPGTYPNQPLPPFQEGQERPPSGEQFAPGTYSNQPPPEGTPGMYPPPDEQTQFVPGMEPTAPISGGTEPAPLPVPPPEGGSGGEPAPSEPAPAPSEPAPMLVPSEPIEQTAPQSSNFDLNNSLAAVITALREFKF